VSVGGTGKLDEGNALADVRDLGSDLQAVWVASDVRRTADRRAQQVSKHADFIRSRIDEGWEQPTLGVFVRISGPASLGLHRRAERVVYLGLTTERVSSSSRRI
jgi:hypothetical protein